jgi:hypothetical protein
MLKKSLVASTLLIAVSVACGGPPQSPTSPSSAMPAGAPAAEGSPTLKASTPTPSDPIHNFKVQNLRPTLTIANAIATHATVTLQHRIQVLDSSGAVVVDSGVLPSSGTTTSYTLTTDLIADKAYTWRARAEYDGRYGAWSSAVTFLTPELTGYILGQELYDPLTDGKSVGSVVGSVDFLPGIGARLNSHGSRITYTLPETLMAGEFSIMVTGIDEGSPGDKSKVMSMQEGGGDITTNDYRATVEQRGRDYPDPGYIVFRFINGEGDDEDYINDAQRHAPSVNMSDEKWYFWKLSWTNAWARLEVRADGEQGPVIWEGSVSTNGHRYAPVPHVIHIGAPVGRGGEKDATIPGLTAKNLWVSARPRPSFPTAR